MLLVKCAKITARSEWAEALESSRRIVPIDLTKLATSKQALVVLQQMLTEEDVGE